MSTFFSAHIDLLQYRDLWQLPPSSPRHFVPSHTTRAHGVSTGDRPVNTRNEPTKVVARQLEHH